MTAAQRSGYFNLAVDLLRSRYGTIPHPYFSTVPLGELTMTAPCAHEDLIAFCPHGCPEGTYDSDTNVCSSCKEPVCPTWNCAYCDEQIGEGFGRPKAQEAK